MTKSKCQNKSKIQNPKSKTKVLVFIICALGLFWILCFGICHLTSAQDEFKYEAKNKRNPFIQIITPDGRFLQLDKEDTKSELIVEGIIYDKYGRSYAIVNGTVVEIGSFVKDFQVLKIEEDKVLFIKEGEIFEGKLKREL
jgi:hypothetical protein